MHIKFFIYGYYSRMKHLIDKIVDEVTALIEEKFNKRKGGSGLKAARAINPSVGTTSAFPDLIKLSDKFYQVLEDAKKNPLATFAAAREQIYGHRGVEYYKDLLPDPDDESEYISDYGDDKLNIDAEILNLTCELNSVERGTVESVKETIESLYKDLKANFGKNDGPSLLDSPPETPFVLSELGSTGAPTIEDTFVEEVIKTEQIMSPKPLANNKDKLTAFNQSIVDFMSKSTNMRQHDWHSVVKPQLEAILKTLMKPNKEGEFISFIIYLFSSIEDKIKDKIKNLYDQVIKKLTVVQTTARRKTSNIFSVKASYNSAASIIIKDGIFLMNKAIKTVIEYIYSSDQNNDFIFNTYLSLKNNGGQYKMNDYIYIIAFYLYFYEFFRAQYALNLSYEKVKLNNFLSYRFNYSEIFLKSTCFTGNGYADNYFEKRQLERRGSKNGGTRTPRNTVVNSWTKTRKPYMASEDEYVQNDYATIPFAVDDDDYDASDKEAFKQDLVKSMRCLYEITLFFQSYKNVYPLVVSATEQYNIYIDPLTKQIGPASVSRQNTPRLEKKIKWEDFAGPEKDLVERIEKYLKYIYNDKLVKVNVKKGKLNEALYYVEFTLPKYIDLFNKLLDIVNQIKRERALSNRIDTDQLESDANTLIKSIFDDSGDKIVLPDYSAETLDSAGKIFDSKTKKDKLKNSAMVLATNTLGDALALKKINEDLLKISEGGSVPEANNSVPEKIDDLVSGWTERIQNDLPKVTTLPYAKKRYAESEDAAKKKADDEVAAIRIEEFQKELDAKKEADRKAAEEEARLFEIARKEAEEAARIAEEEEKIRLEESERIEKENRKKQAELEEKTRLEEDARIAASAAENARAEAEQREAETKAQREQEEANRLAKENELAEARQQKQEAEEAAARATEESNKRALSLIAGQAAMKAIEAAKNNQIAQAAKEEAERREQEAIEQANKLREAEEAKASALAQAEYERVRSQQQLEALTASLAAAEAARQAAEEQAQERLREAKQLQQQQKEELERQAAEKLQQQQEQEAQKLQQQQEQEAQKLQQQKEELERQAAEKLREHNEQAYQALQEIERKAEERLQQKNKEAEEKLQQQKAELELQAARQLQKQQQDLLQRAIAAEERLKQASDKAEKLENQIQETRSSDVKKKLSLLLNRAVNEETRKRKELENARKKANAFRTSSTINSPAILTSLLSTIALSEKKKKANALKIEALMGVVLALVAKAKSKVDDSVEETKVEEPNAVEETVTEKVKETVEKTIETAKEVFSDAATQATETIEELMTPKKPEIEKPVADATQTEKNFFDINQYFKKKIMASSGFGTVTEKCGEIDPSKIDIIEFINNNNPKNTELIDELTTSPTDLQPNSLGDKFEELEITFKVLCGEDDNSYFTAIINNGTINEIRLDDEPVLKSTKPKPKPVEKPKPAVEEKTVPEPELPPEPAPEPEPEPEPKKDLSAAILSILTALTAAAKQKQNL
jgi:hypothetical protein